MAIIDNIVYALTAYYDDPLEYVAKIDSFVVVTLKTLTQLCRIHFHMLINWTSQFRILGLLGGNFHFYSKLKRNFCTQTVENLIRRRILRRLIWFCTVCRCPTKMTLDLYGLMGNLYL